MNATAALATGLDVVPGVGEGGELGADPLDAHPVAAAAQALAVGLAAAAGQVEREGVQRSGLDRLAAAQLLALECDPALGGVAAPAPVVRRVTEILAGADPQTWFVFFQHGPVVRALMRSDAAELRAHWLPRLAAGEALGGVAYSHLRSPRPQLTARPTASGWRLDGVQPWFTGWGLADVVLTGALSTDDEVLFWLLPSGAATRQGVTATPLRLAAMDATHTVALRLDGVAAGEAELVSRTPRAIWTQADRAKNTNVTPSTFGVGLAALGLLAERDADAARSLGRRLAAARTEAYRLLDEVPVEEELDRRLAVRAEALTVAMECATALVVACGGQGMALTHPAQRLLRAAAFQLVHAQDVAVRGATLARYSAEPAAR